MVFPVHILFCRKLKIYEEQELTMQVFNEPEQNALGRRNSDDFVPVSARFGNSSRFTFFAG
jgi:hypothetical protein